MGHQIIKQPNGLYAVWSTIVDDFVMWNATKEDMIQDEIKDAEREIRREYDEIIPILDAGKRYRHFMTWEEALETRKNVQGDEFDTSDCR